MPVAVATSLSPSLLCRPASPRAQVAAHLMVLDTVACYWDFPPLCPPPPLPSLPPFSPPLDWVRFSPMSRLGSILNYFVCIL